MGFCTPCTYRALVLALLAAGLASCSHSANSTTPPQSTASAPAPTSPPTAHSLLHEAITVLATSALGNQRVNWTDVEQELSASMPHDGAPESAYDAINAAVKRLNDPHARFMPRVAPPPAPASPPPSPAPTASASAPTAPPPPQPRIPTTPEGQILADGIAYLVVPGCPGPDVDGLRAYARAAAEEVQRLENSHPSGWVIDLRLNSGGNLWPMLLGLRSLLADGPLMATATDQRVASRFGISEHAAWIDWGAGPEPQLEWDTRPHPTLPLRRSRAAVLLGPWTMSSGEALALCFLAAQNTRTFGEPSAGLTTVTNYFPLSDGSSLNLPVSYMATLDGAALHGKLIPQEHVEFSDWPLPDDAAAAAARRWVLDTTR